MRLSTVSLLTTAVALAVATAQAAQQATPTAPTTPPALGGPRRVPFGVGEVLQYEVRFGPLRVGRGSMEVTHVETVRGRPAWRTLFQVKGGTFFYHVEDRFESWIDTLTLSSLRHVQDINEGSRDRERHFEILLPPPQTVVAPLRQRPVRAAADGERLAQRLWLDAERPGEPLRLHVGADARPEQDVVRRLRDLAGADVADVEHRLGEGLARAPNPVDDLGRAAAVEDEPTLLRAALAADEGRVDHVDASLRASRGELAAGVRPHRRADPHDRARRRGSERVSHRLTHLLVVDDDHEDEVRLRRDLRGAPGARRAQLHERRDRFLGRIEDGDGRSRREEVPRDRASHSPCADDTDSGCLVTDQW